MGGKQSHHHHSQGGSAAPAQEAPSTQETPTNKADTGATAATPVAEPPMEKVDVLIASTNCQQDQALATMIKDALEAVSIAAYITGISEEEVKLAGKLLVDSKCKCFVYVASEEAAKNNSSQDLISLAYISNKTLLVAAETPKKDLLKTFVIGMKMTLNQLHWTVFDVDPPKPRVDEFVAKVQASTTAEPASPTTSIETSTVFTRRGGRLNTKLRQQSTLQDLGGSPAHIDTFWDRNFQSDTEVPWYKFQKCFLDDYEAQLSTLVDEDNVPWLLNLLKVDILDATDKVTKEQFMQVRGESTDNDAFWKVVSQIAVEKFNMKEVFNMNSNVRLTAIEKLATFQSPAVVEALMALLEDEDPNVRAVAAISLGRTGCTDEKVVDKLISLLEDGDRIVRQSACLSLGTMKAKKAIPHIGNRWRNDFISVVRNAARTALENMKIPEAQKVLSVTKVLEDEIAALEGNQAAV